MMIGRVLASSAPNHASDEGSMRVPGRAGNVQDDAHWRRPAGAGAHQLFEAMTKRDAVSAQHVLVALTAPTGPDVAQAIRAGHADCGIATRAVASAAGLDFVPLVAERFDLLMRQRDSYRRPLATLIAALRSPAFAQRAAELGGLDVSQAGMVRWAP